MYDYIKSVKEDILDVLEMDYKDLMDAKDYDAIRDDLWINDSVTGNGSGRYCSDFEFCKKAVQDNYELLKEMATEFDSKDKVIEWLFDEDYYSLDVSLRCLVVDHAFDLALEELGIEDY